MQACDLSAASCLSVIKTRCIHFEQGSKKENSDEEINRKNILSKALRGKQCLVLLVHRRTMLTDDSTLLAEEKYTAFVPHGVHTHAHSFFLLWLLFL